MWASGSIRCLYIGNDISSKSLRSASYSFSCVLRVSKYNEPPSLVFIYYISDIHFVPKLSQAPKHIKCVNKCVNFYLPLSTVIVSLLNQLVCVSCQALKGMPKSPELPVFCKFNYFVMFECVCAIAVSCLLIAFYHMNVNIELPDWVKVRGIFFFAL